MFFLNYSISLILTIHFSLQPVEHPSPRAKCTKFQTLLLFPKNNHFVTKTHMRNLCLSLLGITATSWINEFCVL